MNITQIEDRFLQITKLQNLDLTIFPIPEDEEEKQKPKNDKTKSKQFGEVFTPLCKVDQMIQMKSNLTEKTKTCDFCAGYGQFTVRILRKLYKDTKGKIDIEHWLSKVHRMTQLQPESCAKLVYIFGPHINLFCGDSFNYQYAGKRCDKQNGILFFNKKDKIWEKRPGVTRKINDAYKLLLKDMSKEEDEEKIKEMKKEYLGRLLNIFLAAFKNVEIEDNQNSDNMVKKCRIFDL